MEIRVALKDRTSLKRTFFVSLIVLSISVTVAVNSDYIRNIGPNPPGYSGPFVYEVRYVIETGHIIDVGDVDAPTALSRAVFYGDGVPLHTVFPTIINLAVGSEPSYAIRVALSIMLTLIVFLSVAYLLFSRSVRLLKRMGLSLGALSLILLIVGNSFVLSLLSGSLAGYEIAVTFLCVGLMLTGKLNWARFVALFTLSIFLPMYHFTAGAVYVAFLPFLLLMTSRWRKSIDKRPDQGFALGGTGGLSLYVLLYLVFYCSYVVLFAPSSMSPYRDTVLAFFGGDYSRVGILGSYISGSSPEFFWLNAVETALYLAPVLLVALWAVANTYRHRDVALVIMCMFIPMLLMAFVFYAYMGILGVFQRISLYMIYPSSATMTFGALVGRIFTIALVVSFLVGIPLGLYISAETPYKKGNYALESEEAVSMWVSEAIPATGMVFTDMRLSGLLISQGHLYVVGISDSIQDANAVPVILDSVFYNSSIESIGVGLELVGQVGGGFNVDYVFVSNQMANRYPGILGYFYTYKPAPIDFTSVFDSYEYTNLVCCSGSSNLYSVCH